MNVVCCTMHSNCYAKIAEITIPVMKMYCDKHGYEFHEIKVEDDKWHFRKHKYFQERMLKGGVDAFFYLDIDTIITNFTIKVESFLDDEHELFLTKDVNEINSGVLILKTNIYDNWMNESILNCRDIYENEQNSINFLYNCNDTFKSLTKLLPHPSINSYDYSLYQEFPNIREEKEGHFHSGNFIFHVPALGFEKRIEVLTNIKEQIIYE